MGIFREKGAVRVDVYVAGNYSRTFRHSLDEALQLYYREPDTDAVLDEFITHSSYLDSVLEASEHGRVARHITDAALGTAVIEVLAYHCQPCIVMVHAAPGELGVKFDEEECRHRFAEIDDRVRLFLELDKMPSYGWETPIFRKFCIEFDINPDQGRPTFGPQYQVVGEALVAWAQENHTRYGHRDVPQATVTDIKFLVNQIVDLMRNDLSRSPRLSAYALLDDVRRIEDFWEPLGVPYLEEVKAILANPPQGHLEPGGNSEHIEFLPSQFGSGYTATLTSMPNTASGDGWCDDHYGDMGGIAIEPNNGRSWTKVVVDHLRDQGVVFLSGDQIEAYRNGEGVYWEWRHGLRNDIGIMRGTLWEMKKPPTPLSDLASRRHQAAMLLRGRAIPS